MDSIFGIQAMGKPVESNGKTTFKVFDRVNTIVAFFLFLPQTNQGILQF